MAEWRHTLEVAACDWTGDTDMEYPVCGVAGCGHTKVEPDPTSPCRCGRPLEAHDLEVTAFYPTRCLACGHGIEAIQTGPAASGSEGGTDHG